MDTNTFNTSNQTVELGETKVLKTFSTDSIKLDFTKSVVKQVVIWEGESYDAFLDEQ